LVASIAMRLPVRTLQPAAAVKHVVPFNSHLLLALLVWLAGLCDDPPPGMLMPESVW